MTAVNYGASVIVAKPGDANQQGDGTDVAIKDKNFRVVSMPELASKVEIGKRIPSVKVLNQSDARPWHFQELFKSNGRWRVVVFPGDLNNACRKHQLAELGQRLAGVDSFLTRFTPSDQRYDSVFELLAVHSGSRASTTIFDFPEVFRPYDQIDGWDYWKIFVDDESYHEGHGQIYENFGIDPQEGCTIIVRPDQYVSYVGRIEAYDDLDKFFSSFMLPQRQVGRTVVNNHA